jgi:uncharacterized membrane protein
MEERPKIKLELTTADKTFEIIGWLLVISVWGLTITNYANLPETIPTHYNGAGQADEFGGKATILTLPLIATVLFVGLTILNKFPHIFNYPTNITQDNALRQYTNATRMIRYLKLIIVVIFGLIEFKTIQNANGQADGLGIWFLPMTLGLIFIPLIYFVVKLFKATKVMGFINKIP